MGNAAKILVVDDEPTIRGILSETLGPLGHAVTEASSAEEAMEQMSKTAFHLIMTDIRMPGLTGIELLERVKQKRVETDVIIMTSNASVDSTIQAIRFGAADYLLKPFEDLEYVEMVVQRVLDKQFLKRQNQELLANLKQKNEELVKATQRAAQILADSGSYYGMGREILESRDQADLLQRVPETLSKFMKGKPFLFWLYDPQQQALVIHPQPGMAAALIPPIPLPESALLADEGPGLWLLRKGYLPMLSRQTNTASSSGFADFPLVFQGRGYGLIVLLQRKPEELAAYETAFLNHLCTLTAATLRQYQQSAALLETGPSDDSRIAVRDPITPLYHFDYFLEILGMEIARSRRYRHKFTLLMATLNPPIDPEKDPKRKPLFASLSECFYKRIRATDFATRCGHKFFILLPETDQENARKVFQALSDRIEEIALAQSQKNPKDRWAVQLSMVEYPKDADTLEGLISTLETRLPH
jgi:PleD family two-component response regulator